MEETLGIDAGGTLIDISVIVYITLILFFVVSPIGGYYLYKFMRFKLPMADTLALLAGAFCAFLISFAAAFLSLRRFAPQFDETNALFLSLGFGLIVTLVTALAIRSIAKRSSARVQEDHAFRVWDEDQRKRPKTYRRR
ncbi:MAG: hypothetical protein K8L99_21985 [Anaerolineae bacterium]|nr:hypothetical protein [Anaerolineae bacterium]